MISGKYPFNGKDSEEVIKNVKKAEVLFPDKQWEGISEGAKDLISKMLLKSNKKRITASKALKHPWIKKQAGKYKVNINQATTILDNLRSFKYQSKF